MRALACIFLMLSLPPAHALFLVGQAQEGGEVSILCEGQAQAFLSTPSGSLRALPLDGSSQARFFPQQPGPHTVQCGKETRTITVSLPAWHGSEAYGGGGTLTEVSCVAAAFIAAALLLAKRLRARGTEFSKREENGRVKISLHAGEDLSQIRITDPDGGEAGLELLVPRLPSGREWSWEYERDPPGSPLAPARMSARGAKGEVLMFSGAKGPPGGAAKRAVPLRKNQE